MDLDLTRPGRPGDRCDPWAGPRDGGRLSQPRRRHHRGEPQAGRVRRGRRTDRVGVRRARPCRYAAHVGRWAELDGLVDAAYERFGHVDVLVNNAGMSPLYDGVDTVTEELFDKVVAVNLKGPFRLAALVGTRMAADGRRVDHQHQQHGCGAPAGGHPPVRGRQGRAQRVDGRAGAHVRADGPLQRHHGRHVHDRRQHVVGRGRRSSSARRRSRCGAAADPTRSSALRSTWPAMPPGTRPARS